MSEKKIEIGGRLHSIATGNVLAGANEIFDDDKNKKQNDINTETYTLVNNVNERLNGLSPDQQSALTVAAKATNNETKLGYYVCGTEGNVAAKVISDATGYILSKGGSMKVKMTNANTAANATLNINSTGAKPLYYDGERASVNNSWEAGETVEVYYDGTNFYANNVTGGSGSGDGAFDISAKTGQNYETLTAALTAANTILPASKKKGGMSIKFIQLTPAIYSVVKTEGLTEQPTGTEVQEALAITDGTYTAAQLPVEAPATTATYWLSVTETVEDVETTTYTTWVITKVTADKSEYVQYRLMSTDWSNVVTDWQGVDDEPTAGSNNLVKSGGAELLNHPYSNPVVVQDATNLTAESSDESRGTCVKNEDNSFTLYKNGYGAAYGYIGVFDYDKDQENYLCLDYTLIGDVDGFYIVLKDAKGTSGHDVGFQQIFNGSGSLEIPLSNTYQGKYIVASFSTLSYHARLILSNVRIVTDNKSTIKENFDDVRAKIESKANSSDVLQALGKKSEITKWPRVFGNDDYDFKGLSEDGKAYIYIYEVGSRVHLNAMIDSPYIMWSAICDSMETAKLSASNGTVFAGNGNYRTQYRWGNSSLKKGFLAIKVSRTGGWPVLTTEDVTAIEESIDISIYSIEDLAEDVDNRVRELERDSYTKNDFEKVAITDNGTISYNNNPTRFKFIRDGVKAKKLLSVDVSDVITTVPSAVYGAAVFKTLDGALRNTGSDGLQTLVTAWSTSSASEVEMTSDGVLSIYFKKSNGSAFTYTEIKAIESNLDILLAPVTIAPEEDSAENYDSLPVNEFVSTSSTLVSAASITCVPRLGVTYRFVLPDSINARFAYGTSYNNLTNYTPWSVNGESVTIPNSYISQRLQFQKSNGGNISVAEIQEHISSGTIKILYDKKELSVIERNYESEQFVKAMMYRFVWPDSASITAGQDVHSLATLVHVSDLHGDFKRFENAVEYAKMLGADAVIASGDNVMNTGSSGTLYMKDVITKHGYSPFLNCIGNHETKPAQTYGNTALFNSHISPYVEQGGYKADESTAATMPYYYVDLASINLRIITLNQFDSGCYYGEGCGGRLGQAQVTWFCNTLLSTPVDYGVVIVMHANEDQIDTPETMNAWNQTVTATGGNEDTSGYCHNGLYVNAMRPIKTIVDAFIEKTALSTTYDENTQNGNTGETVTIDVDFSNVNTGVEFICYLTGHRHKDNIGYVHTATNKQLILNVVTSNCHYPRTSDLSFAEGSDIPRGDSGVTQDAFNVYAIDRRKGVVKIARVGSSVNFEGVERRFLIAPYKD